MKIHLTAHCIVLYMVHCCNYWLYCVCSQIWWESCGVSTFHIHFISLQNFPSKPMASLRHLQRLERGGSLWIQCWKTKMNLGLRGRLSCNVTFEPSLTETSHENVLFLNCDFRTLIIIFLYKRPTCVIVDMGVCTWYCCESKWIGFYCFPFPCSGLCACCVGRRVPFYLFGNIQSDFVRLHSVLWILKEKGN